MRKYATMTRTGEVVIEAESRKDALNKLNQLKNWNLKLKDVYLY